MSRGFLRAAVICIVTVFFTFPASTVFPGNFVGFGPQNYTRGTGSPVAVTNAFTVLNPNTSYTLKINNGGLVDGEFEKVSSAVISLNGVQIVGPNEFNQNVTLIEKPITLAASNQLSVELRGKPGGGITIQIIGIDNDPPTITASVNPPSNATGWNSSGVTVSFTCSDATSGIASCPNPMSVSTEGANQVVSGTAVDRAGNTASTSVTLNIDKTPPTLSPTVTPQPNLAGWHKSDATVSFTCTDATSGIAVCPSPVTVNAEGANQIISGTATDLAGNSATASLTVSLDKSAPTIATAVNPAPNAAGWHKSDATVSFTCTDATSGIAVCPSPVTVNAEGANQLISGTSTDLAGNSASTSVFISLDKTAPSVAINSPANGSSFTSSPVNVTSAATDNLSGIATVLCNGSPAALTTSTFSCDVPLTDGPNTITVEAADIAGNTSTSSITVNLSTVQVAVRVTPEQADVTVKQTQQFIATVLVTTDQRVTWSVSGGDGTFGPGSIDDTGLYTAPNNAPEPPFVTIKATSVADPSASGTAQVVIRELANFGQSNTDGDLNATNMGDYLQIGWGGLPVGTAKIVLSRAPNKDGSWTAVLIDEFPDDLTSSGSIVYSSRSTELMPLDTAHDYFYKLEAFSSTGALLKSYSPVFVPKFAGPSS